MQKIHILRAIKINPKHYAALNNLGSVCRTLEDFKSADKYFVTSYKIKT